MKVLMKRKSKSGPAKVSPEEVTARLKAVLSQLSGKGFTLLSTVKSFTKPGGTPYEIRLGTSGAVYCTCKGWQYSKTGSCKHLEHFRAKCVPQSL